MTPFEYQETGARFLASRRRAALLDGCRCGKTIQAVVGSDYIGAERILVVCPGLARSVWQKTFELASLLSRPMKVVVDATDPIEPNGVTILSMDGSRNGELHSRVMNCEWDLLIIDEQHFLKTPDSQRTRQILSRQGFAARAKRIWFLTATPLMKDPADTWTMLRTIGIYKGSYEDFLNRFCVWFKGEFGPVVKALKRSNELKEMISKVSIRRVWDEVKHQVTDMPTPDPVWENIELDYTGTIEDDEEWMVALRDLEADERVLRDLKRWTAGGQVKLAPGAPMARLRNCISMIKAKPLAQFIGGKLGSGEWDKVVIMFHHSLCGQLMRDYLREFDPKLLYGGTPQNKRDKIIELFWTRYSRRIILCNATIARQAIDLSCANQLVFAEMDWIPDNNYQASMRIQGPMQDRQPFVYTTTLKDTLDEAVMAVNDKRSKMFSEILS